LFLADRLVVDPVRPPGRSGQRCDSGATHRSKAEENGRRICPPCSRTYPALVFAVNARASVQEETLVQKIHRAEGSPAPHSFFHVGRRPAKRPRAAAGWRINGYAARLVIWSQEEWDKLEVRPMDAQYHPHGVWCALRLE